MGRTGWFRQGISDIPGQAVGHPVLDDETHFFNIRLDPTDSGRQWIGTYDVEG